MCGWWMKCDLIENKSENGRRGEGITSKNGGNNKGGGKNNDNIVKVDTSATVNANVSIVQNKIKIAKGSGSCKNAY